MARSYSALGPGAQMSDPAFSRQLALMLSRGRGGGGGGRQGAQGPLDYLTNDLAKDRYARAMLDEQLRGAITQRENMQAAPDLAREGMDIQGRGMNIKDRGLEAQIAADLARQQMGQQRLGMERERLGMMGPQMDLQNRMLDETIRHAKVGEGLQERALTESPEAQSKAMELGLMQQSVAQGQRGEVRSALQNEGVRERVMEMMRGRDVGGVKRAIEFLRNFTGSTATDAAIAKEIVAVLHDLATEMTVGGNPLKEAALKVPRWLQPAMPASLIANEAYRPGQERKGIENDLELYLQSIIRNQK